MRSAETRYILQKIVHVGPVPVTVEYEARRDRDGCPAFYRITDAYVEDLNGENRTPVLDYFEGEDFEWLERQLDPESDAVIDQYEFDCYDGPES